MYTLNFIHQVGDYITYTVNTGSKTYKRKLNNNYFNHCGFNYTVDSGKIILLDDVAVKAKPLLPLVQQSEFTINQRFSFLERFVDMVIKGITPSIVITGEGGLGKTHTTMAKIDYEGLIEGTDYVVIKGYATPKALYKSLLEHKDKIVIFDDCDSILRDPIALNILKGALELDKSKKRTISWLSAGFIDDGVPKSFDFDGSVIFISNMPSNKVDQAIKSRAITIDLSMTIADKIERMRAIVGTILPNFDIAMKLEVLEYIEEHAYEATDLNMRTLDKCCKVRYVYGDDPSWRSAAKYLMTNI